MAAAALAVARGVAVARVRRADRRRRGRWSPACRSRARAPTRSARVLVAGVLQPARGGASSRRSPGWLLRRRRRDLPFVIARDYAGTALLVADHRGAADRRRAGRTAPRVRAERADQRGGLRARCTTTSPATRAGVRAGLGTLDICAARGRALPRLRLPARGAAPALPLRQHRPVARRDPADPTRHAN